MAEKLIGKLYKDTVEVVFTPGNHRYSVIDNGVKTFPFSVTSITGVIDKSPALMYWAVNLAVDYVINYITLETQPTKEEILQSIVDVQKELTQDQTILEKFTDKIEAMVGAFRAMYSTIQGINSTKKFSREELINVLEQARKQHTIRKLEAADIGTQVHDLIEQYVLAKINKKKFSLEDELDERVVNGFNAFLDWEKKNHVEFLYAEKLIYSRTYGYVGMTDCIAKVNSKLYLLDWKTGKAIYQEMIYQVSAYGKAHEEESGDKLEGLMIIHLNKDTGEFDTRDIPLWEYEESIEVFIHCLAIKKHLKVLDKRKLEMEEAIVNDMKTLDFTDL